MQITSIVGNDELKSIVDDPRQTNDKLSRPSSIMSFIHSETMPSPVTDGTLNHQGQIYSELTQTPSTGRDISDSAFCLSENY